MGAAGLALLGCEGGDSAIVLSHPLIIGSGFGGSVAALRLAEAGIGATVLERGRRWVLGAEGGTFCSMRDPDERASWLSNRTHVGLQLPVPRFTGLIERYPGDNIDAIVAAAVGGGSIVYAGMMVQPPRDLFEAVFPAEVSYDQMLDTWYARAAVLLQPAPIPADILASETYAATRIFMQHAETAGVPAELALNALDWDLVRAEVSGELPPEAIYGDYLYGLNSGAKRSLDRTYLAMAEATGLVDVRPLHQVSAIAAEASGGYRVSCDLLDDVGNVTETVVFTAPALFLAAGSIHTTRLLVEARARGDLPMLSADVGEGWGHNGQHIFMRGGLTETVGAFQGGPPAAVIRDLANPIAPVTMEHGAAAFGYECNCLISPVSSLNDGFGRLRWDGTEEKTMLEWDPANGVTGVMAGENLGDRLNAANGGMNTTLPGGTRRSTFHSLGGVVMGRASDTFGRVMGYEGLYALDGSIIPGATPTANPAWTITALAERAIDTIIREDLA